MKLNEMADLLTGLATFMEKHLKSDATKDLQAVSECFRTFGDETVGNFCSFVVKAKDGKPAAKAKPTAVDAAKVNELTRAIQHFLDNPEQYDIAAVRQLAGQLKPLKNKEIEAVGEHIVCRVRGSKSEMLAEIENWLVNSRILSVEQSDFSLSASGVG